MRLHACVLCVAISSIGPLCARAAAQTLDHDAAPGLPRAPASEPAPSNVSPLSALGDHVFGPLDLESVTGDNGCLGVEAAFGFIYVSGRSTGVGARAIYKLEGVLLVSQTMTAGMAFHGGTLCLQTATLTRKGATNSGGTPGLHCDGAFAIDVNAFAQNLWMVPDCAGNPAGPVATSPPYLRVPGSGVFAQIWGRDTVTTGPFLSDALAWVVGP
jgi:hypothetical protein